MKSIRSCVLSSLGVAGALLVASAAHAQDAVPAGTMKQDAASSGTTDVATSGTFEAVTLPPADAAKDAVEAQILGGGALSTGNARSLSVTSSATFRIRRTANQFSALAAVNYGRAAVNADAETETTVDNQQGKIRYDRFITENFVAFLAASGRRDRFQGLNLRLNIDPGIGYYFIAQEKQQFWGELGYDFQFDIRNQDALDAAEADGTTLDKTKTAHSGRLFAGYNNALNESVTFKTGLEYLQGLDETKSWRLNWDAALTSKIGGNFSLATTFSLRYDHNPLPGIKNTDTQSAVSLVYSLL
jgi:putative salt-induced outer membrane protein